jgi:hypothetical protein
MEKFLKPRSGLLVRDPGTFVPLSQEGEWKPWTGPLGRFWRRRVMVGDCEEAVPNQPASKRTRKMTDKEE